LGAWNRARRALDAIDVLLLKLKYDLPSIELRVITQSSNAKVRPAVLECICLPPYQGSSLRDDFTALISIARSLNARTIVELGTAHGNTVANLCYYFPDARVVTVNALETEQSGYRVTFALQKHEIGYVFRKYGFADQVQQVLVNTLNLDLSTVLAKATVDLVIIDACHDTKFVLNDFEKVRHFVRPGGVVLFHDTAPAFWGHLAGSYRACMHLRKSGIDVVHIDSTWWGIWRNDFGSTTDHEGRTRRT
jgi:predicted O-methyltransferase YrrM